MPQTPEEPKSLEMRIAAIEDKLSQMTVTEEEMRAYQKVTSLMAGAGGRAGATPVAAPGISPIIYNCIHITPIHITPIHIGPIIINDCIQASGSQAASGGTGFGTLGRQS